MDAVWVRRSAGDLDLPPPSAPRGAPATSSRSADGVDLTAQERLAARNVEATCCNLAVELPESCVAFDQSVSGTFNDRASPSQDAVILLSPNESAPTLFVSINKGALSLLLNFFRTDRVFDCEKKWLRLSGLEQPLELIEVDCTEPYVIATAMHLCHWVNDCPEANAWPEYADSFDKRTCLSVIQAIDHLSCDRPGSTAKLVQAQLWSMIERELVSALCDCAVSGIYEDDKGGRMLLLTVFDRNESHTCTSSCTSDACSDGEVKFDSTKLGELVDGMNQDISSFSENSPLRNKLAKCCQRVMSPCTSRKDLAMVDRLIDKLPVEFRHECPATYFSTSPSWMRQAFRDGGCSNMLEYGHFVTSEADQEDPITWAMINKADEGDWFVQSRTYTHPHKAGYQMISVALVRR